MRHYLPAFAMSLMVAAQSLSAAPPGKQLKTVPFTDVQVQDTFWQPRIETNRTVTLPHNIKQCEITGRIDNFSKAAGKIKGEFKGIFFNDSDVYKVLEGAAYCLAQHPDKELEAKIDQIITEIAAAQEPDGYINTYYTLDSPTKKWTNLCVKHELYCAGHMFEAAVAYAQATGKTTLLEVSRRKADHIDNLFGPAPGKRLGYPGHQEIELALVKLYRYTGEKRYLDLADHFLNVRGTFKQGDKMDPANIQAHKPIREQTDIVGHAVRAMYMYAGVADVAAYTGDEGFIRTMDTIWHNVVDKKMYITGGIGSRRHGEAFGDDYELPNDTAYCETCAAIGMALWNQRLAMLYADGRYADIVERAIYNGILSGVSLQGDKFFYVNPLSRKDDPQTKNGKHTRQPFYDCACCPSNVVRFLPSIPGYVYAATDDAVWVNQYMAGTAKIKLASGNVTLVQKADYPWSGEIAISVQPAQPAEFDIFVRIPGWCRSFGIKVAGAAVADPVVDAGYVKLHRSWKAGDTIELSLAMPVEQMQSHPYVASNLGRVALQRGPVVYCLEAVDNGGTVSNLVLSENPELTSRKQADLLGGVVVVKAKGYAVAPADWANKLYQPLTAAKPVELTAIPYYAWDHRGLGGMAVWIAQSPTLTATVPEK